MTSASEAQEHAVMVARLYECRTTLQFLYGNQYPSMVQAWQDMLVNTLPPGESLVSHVTTSARNANDPAVSIWLFAALVEILEAKES